VFVSSDLAYELFLPDTFAVHQGLHGRTAFTDFALMSAFIVVVIDPLVQIDLQLLDGFMELPAECHLIKLLQDSLVEPLTDAVGLR
jgi:hypothetical protein